MMFDAHAHWLPQEIIENAHFYSDAWGSVETQLSVMDRYHIDKTLIVYPTNDAHVKMGGLSRVARVYNNRIAEITSRYPDRLVGGAILPVDNPEEMAKEFKHVTEELGFRALSLGTSFEGIYLDDERFCELYAQAESLDIPIFVHPQTINPIGCERVKHPLLTPVIEFVFDTTICIAKLITSGTLNRFPNLKFVFAHFGGVMPFIKERFDSIYKMLLAREIVGDLGDLPSEYLKKIFVDTSGVTSSHALMCTIDMVGIDHVLWGSDYPGNPNVLASVRAIEELDIPSEEEAKILGLNISRILP